jgi:hypothetical protein
MNAVNEGGSAGFALDRASNISSRSVHGGWLLRGLLVANPTLAQCRLALRMSYQSLRWVKAGIAVEAETGELVLMQWHSQMPRQSQIHEQLEAFQRGLELWKRAFDSAHHQSIQSAIEMESKKVTTENRMRQKILGNHLKMPPSFRTKSQGT